jgi:hypothetical protein
MRDSDPVVRFLHRHFFAHNSQRDGPSRHFPQKKGASPHPIPAVCKGSLLCEESRSESYILQSNQRQRHDSDSYGLAASKLQSSRQSAAYIETCQELGVHLSWMISTATILSTLKQSCSSTRERNDEFENDCTTPPVLASTSKNIFLRK